MRGLSLYEDLDNFESIPKVEKESGIKRKKEEEIENMGMDWRAPLMLFFINDHYGPYFVFQLFF